MENRVTRRELAPISHLGHALEKVAALTRAELEAIPAICKRNFPWMRDSELQILKRELVKVSDEIADIQLYG